LEENLSLAKDDDDTPIFPSYNIGKAV